MVDRTGLRGAFDVKMTRFNGGAAGTASPNAGAGDRPDMFTAVQDMLGLKLEIARGTVDVLIVENVERPTED